MDQTVTTEIDNSDENPQSSIKGASSFWTSLFAVALKDYIDGFMKWRMWGTMAFAELRARYRRTLIGPFWTTLSLAILIGSMGFLFSILWHLDVKSFLPYFASGYISWIFFSALITDSCQTFISSEGILKQIALPYGLFAWLVVARNTLVFFHQIVIFIVIAIFFHVSVNAYTLLVIPGLLLFIVTGSWISTLLGLLCARYRDFQQVIVSLLQVTMFVTPIMWPVNRLGHSFKAYLLVNGNPVYHYISIIRQPLLGQPPSMLNWIVVCIITLCGWFLTIYIMSHKQRKLIFWII